MLSSLVFAVAYAIKGGWHYRIGAMRVAKDRLGQWDWITSGKLLSSILVSVYLMAYTGDPIETLKYSLAWIIAVTPSMGEEAGAIGRYGYWWGKYRELGFTRSYGVKKALQRGCWIGAVFVLAGSSIAAIPALTLGFVFAHFIAQEAHYRIHKEDSWAYAEPLVGAMIGAFV